MDCQIWDNKKSEWIDIQKITMISLLDDEYVMIEHLGKNKRLYRKNYNRKLYDVDFIHDHKVIQKW